MVYYNDVPLFARHLRTFKTPFNNIGVLTHIYHNNNKQLTESNNMKNEKKERKRVINRYSRVASLITAVVVSYLFIIRCIHFFFTYKIYYFPFFSAPSNIPAVRLVYTAMTATTITRNNNNNNIIVY